MSRPSRALMFVLPAFFSTTLVAGNVLVVDAAGGAAFTEISAAVAVAAPGDVVLVRSGTYAPFVIDGLSLTVAADLGASVQVFGGFPGPGGVQTRNLAAGQSVVLRGLVVSAPGFTAALAVRDCQGAVLVEDCTFLGETTHTAFTREAVRIQNSARVTLVRCLALGGTAVLGALPFNGGHGLVVAGGSAAHLYDCTLLGGCGTFYELLMVGDGGDGGHVMDGSFLYASGSRFQGGDGGPGSSPCLFPDAGDGGAGLRLLGTPPQAELLDIPAAGGLGGPGPGGGCPPGANGLGLDVESGTANIIPGVARTMSAAHPVREGQTLVIDFSGLAGDLAVVGLSDAHQPVFLPALEGSLVVAPAPLSITVFGVLPAAGTLTANVAIPPVTGVDAALHFVQLAVATPTMPTDIRLGTAQSLLLLDAAF